MSERLRRLARALTRARRTIYIRDGLVVLSRRGGAQTIGSIEETVSGEATFRSFGNTNLTASETLILAEFLVQHEEHRAALTRMRSAILEAIGGAA